MKKYLFTIPLLAAGAGLVCFLMSASLATIGAVICVILGAYGFAALAKYVAVEVDENEVPIANPEPRRNRIIFGAGAQKSAPADPFGAGSGAGQPGAAAFSTNAAK